MWFGVYCRQFFHCRNIMARFGAIIFCYVCCCLKIILNRSNQAIPSRHYGGRTKISPLYLKKNFFKLLNAHLCVLYYIAEIASLSWNTTWTMGPFIWFPWWHAQNGNRTCNDYVSTKCLGPLVRGPLNFFCWGGGILNMHIVLLQPTKHTCRWHCCENQCLLDQ